MKEIESRLRKLERDSPQNEAELDIRGIVRSLPDEDARFCYWVLHWQSSGEVWDGYDYTNLPTPTKADEHRAMQILREAEQMIKRQKVAGGKRP